jgi:hypothetical protein
MMVFQLLLIVGFHFIQSNETEGNSPGYGRAFQIKLTLRLKKFNRKKNVLHGTKL